jgi:hypothetical protein
MRIATHRAALFISLCIGLLVQTASAAFLPPDTTVKLEAYQLATNNMVANPSGTNKMILMIVSDTNSCTACRSLEFGILPSQQMMDFLAESFVYWACGPEVNCSSYTEYAGSGSLALPMSYVINPFSGKGVYAFSASGADSAGTYFEWLSKSLLRSTSPRITGITFTSPTTVVVSGQSISTNVALRTVKYKVNDGAWTSQTIPAGTWASAFQLPALTVPQGTTSKLYIYGMDSSATYKTKTNIVSLIQTVQPVDPTVTVTASPGATTTYGQAVTFTATCSGANGTPTGTVQFQVNGVNLGTPVALVSGAATSIQATPAKGTATVTAVYSGDTGYNAKNGTHTQTVNAATLTVTATGVNKVYDGTTAAQANYADNRLAGDSLTVTGTAVFTSRNTGLQAISVTGITISGTSAANYQLGSTATTTAATITPRSITVSAVADTKVADGTTASTKTPLITVGSLATGDTAGFTQAFENALVGTNKTIIPAGIVNDGNNGQNYTVSFVPSTSGVIEASPLPPVGVAVSPLYSIVTNGASVTFTGTTTNGTGNETFQWVKDGVALTGKTDIALTIANVSQADAGAYQLLASSGGTTASSKSAGLWVTGTPKMYMALPVFGPASNAIYLQVTENLKPNGAIWNVVTNSGVRGLGPQVVVSEEYSPTNALRFYRLFIPQE